MSNKAIKDDSVFETRRFTSAFFFSMQVAISLFLISFFPNGKGKIGGGWETRTKRGTGRCTSGKKTRFFEVHLSLLPVDTAVIQYLDRK